VDYADTSDRTPMAPYGSIAVDAITLARIESGFVTPAGYLGWTDPVCAGALAPWRRSGRPSRRAVAVISAQPGPPWA
jgi:hypothetical protein